MGLTSTVAARLQCLWGSPGRCRRLCARPSLGHGPVPTPGTAYEGFGYRPLLDDCRRGRAGLATSTATSNNTSTIVDCGGAPLRGATETFGHVRTSDSAKTRSIAPIEELSTRSMSMITGLCGHVSTEKFHMPIRVSFSRHELKRKLLYARASRAVRV